MPIRKYIRMTHRYSMGHPVYFNEAKNIMMLGARGFGKSYSLGVGVVLHE